MSEWIRIKELTRTWKLLVPKAKEALKYLQTKYLLFPPFINDGRFSVIFIIKMLTLLYLVSLKNSFHSFAPFTKSSSFAVQMDSY
jgi:hypothetical protein